MDSRHSSQIWGVKIKHLSLIGLALQNSALIPIMHYSRIMPAVGGRHFYPSTAVFLSEVMKLAISLTLALYDLSSSMPSSLPVTSLFKELIRLVFTEDSWKLAIPAALFCLQNTLQYMAISNLNAIQFQVTYQLKLLTTAFFAWVLLGSSQSIRKCLCLILLIAGVAIVQIPSEPNLPTLQDLKDSGSGSHLRRDLGRNFKRSATYEGIDEDFALQHPQMDASVGLVATIAASVLSGLASVYFEKILKSSNTKASVWIRNVQLAFYSLFPALFVGVVFNDGADISRDGFFVGYNWVVWTTIILQALGGILVALAISHANSITKNLTGVGGVIATSLGGFFFFKTAVTTSYLLGITAVINAICLYGGEETRHRPPPIVIADYEKTTVGDESSYFDLPSGGSLKVAKSPIRGEAVSSSRPSTPTFERRHFSGNSLSKREE